jgi:hypothetical protein
MSQSAQSQSSRPIFTIFPELPIEIRLKVYGHACYQPRNITLNTEFVHQEVNNTIFYTQRYFSTLTKLLPPAILSVSKEARAEALNHYELAFQRTTSMGVDGENHVYKFPGFWINWECDRIVPRGFYNIIGMNDFLSRIQGKLRGLAVDVVGDFYKDVFESYLMKDTYPFSIVKEIILYDGHEFLPFKKKYSGPKIELEFRPMLDESDQLQGCQSRLSGRLGDMVAQMNARNEEAGSDSVVRPTSVTYWIVPAVQIMQPLEGRGTS